MNLYLTLFGVLGVTVLGLVVALLMLWIRVGVLEVEMLEMALTHYQLGRLELAKTCKCPPDYSVPDARWHAAPDCPTHGSRGTGVSVESDCICATGGRRTCPVHGEFGYGGYLKERA